MKKLEYRGFIIIEENGELVIYQGTMLVKRVAAKWKSGITEAKATVDRLIKQSRS